MAARTVRILRPDNLGDVILFSGALRHIRALYPEARLSFIGKRYALPLLEPCPHVDERIPWEVFEENLPSPRYRPPGEGWWARRVRHARRRRDRRVWHRFSDRFACDVLLLPVRSPTPLMHQVLAAIPADEKIGIAGDSENQTKEDDEAAAAFYTRRMELAPERRFAPELETTHAFLRFLGADVPLDDVRPEVWTTDADRQRSREAVPRAAGAITIGIAPGRTEIQRLFPPEHYAAAVAQIGDSRHSVVLLGAPGEEELCERVGVALRAQGFTGGVLDLCGKLSLRELAEAIRRVDVLVSLDSAPVHLGASLGKPVVGVRGGGHIGRFWPWGDPRLSRVAATELDCYGCNWVCVHERVRCVEEIPVETLRAGIQAAIACLPAAFEA